MASCCRAVVDESGSPSAGRHVLGVVDSGRVLAAVRADPTRAGPHYGQVSDVVAAQIRGRRDAGTPDWVVRYTEKVANIHDVAVATELRRKGIGAALVRAATTALSDRGAHTVAGFATNPASVALFRACEYVVGGLRQPVPKDIAAGLTTLWDPALPDAGRYFWKVLAQRAQLSGPGTAFGLR